MTTYQRCYWCNREIQPDDLSMGMVFIHPKPTPTVDDDGLRGQNEPRPFHTVCLGAIGGSATDD